MRGARPVSCMELTNFVLFSGWCVFHSSLEFIPVYDKRGRRRLHDMYVVELHVMTGAPLDIYETGKGER